ncbi:MAG: hydrogenase maturation protease [Pyrinomonadaceae bacterium]|nr:hydrogenase maturation protease [Pyrinomonadaceae bacterium]
MKILVAGVGNVLRGDDGFGVAVAQALFENNTYGSEVTVFEAGIAGVALVQELMSGYDVLIVADTIHRGGRPGTIYVIEPEVPELDEKLSNELHQSLADAHYSDPSKVLILAKALNVLPRKVFLVGCEPASYDELAADLSPAIERAIAVALEEIESIISRSRKQSESVG